MNVGFDGYNSVEVGEIMGVDKSSVIYWCRNGYIRYQDVSEPGSTMPRYLFTDDEVSRVKGLRKKYGRAWVRHSNEGLTMPKPKTEDTVVPSVANIKSSVNEVHDKSNGTNGIIRRIEKVKELKDELNDLEARRNQIMAEIEILKNEIIDAI